MLTRRKLGRFVVFAALVSALLLWAAKGAAAMPAAVFAGKAHHTGAATLRVVVRELPHDAAAQIVVTGPRRYRRRVERSSSLTVPAGAYVVSAGPVRASSGVYYATASRARASVRADHSTTVTVAYATLVPKSTRVVAASETKSLSGSPSGPRVLTLMGAAARGVEVGEILSSAATAAAPYGYLVKVTKVEREGDGSAVLSVVNATLLEALTTGEINTEAALEPTAEAASIEHGGSADFVMRHSGRGRARVASFSFHAADLDCTTSAGVHVNAPTLTFTPSLAVHAHWGFLKLDSASISVTVAEAISLGATADAGAHCETSSPGIGLFPHAIPLATVPIPVGPIVVTVTPELQLYLSGQATITAKAAVSLEQDASATVGASYEHGSFSPISSFSQHFTPAFTAEGDASGELALTPTVDTLLYGIAGPSFDVGAVAKLNADVTETPWWTLQGCLQAGLGFVISPLDLDWSDPHLIQVCKTLLSASTGPPAGAVEASTPPANSAAPMVTDAQGNDPPMVGDTLQATTGSWSGSPTSYEYQWERCATASVCGSLPGATSSSYKVVSGDAGSALRVSVTARNAAGASQPAASAVTGVVTASSTEGPGGESGGHLTWTGLEAPLPSGGALERGLGEGFRAISCPVEGSCVAVGDTDLGAWIESLSDGKWTAIEGPLPSRAESDPSSYLSSVSCVNAAYCVAVGAYRDHEGYWSGLIETLSAGKWAATSAPLPANAKKVETITGEPGADLFSVSCRSVGECFAVGRYYPEEEGPSDSEPLVDSLTGSSWTATSLTRPTESYGVDSLYDLTCPTAGFCVAVGALNESDGLIAEWDGSGWSDREAPAPTDAPEGYGLLALEHVACASATHCVALTMPIYDRPAPLEEMNGTTWEATILPTPAGAPAHADVHVAAVGCAPGGICVASGRYEGEDNRKGTFLAQQSGSGEWSSVAPAQEPSELSDFSREVIAYELDGISCPAAEECIGAGAAEDYVPSQKLASVDAWADHEWQPATLLQFPNAKETYYEGGTAKLNAVSCASTTWCVAVGNYLSGSGEHGLIEVGEE